MILTNQPHSKGWRRGGVAQSVVARPSGGLLRIAQLDCTHHPSSSGGRAPLVEAQMDEGGVVITRRIILNPSAVVDHPTAPGPSMSWCS